MRIPFQIKRNKKDILGLIHIAEKQYETPLIVVMCYGANGNRVEEKRMGVRFGNACEKSGINLVRFDFTNVGLSEGDFFYSTKQERINDTIEVINHVISFFDKKIKIFILGFCDGANIAAGAFNNINIEINKLIFWNPNILFNKENDKNDEINITYISKINKYCIDFQGVYMNFMFYKDIIHNQLFDFIINNEEYCHIFLASNDNSYINYNNILIKKPQKKIKHLEIINGGGHLFFSTETENMLFKKTINCILE